MNTELATPPTPPKKSKRREGPTARTIALVMLLASLVIAGCGGTSDPIAAVGAAAATPSEDEAISEADTAPTSTEPIVDEVDLDVTEGGVLDDPSAADVAEQPFEEGLFYGNFDEGVLLFAGATTEDFCNDIQPTATSRVFTHDDGSVEIEVDDVVWPIHLYASPLGAPELIDETCMAMFDDDPDTLPVEPYATGEGQVQARIEVAPDGTEHVVNSAEGSATSSDGTVWQVRGHADLQIVDGVPVGDPAEFQGLSVREDS